MLELMSGSTKVGGPFTLTDDSGERRSLADFRGKVVLLYFGYTFCPDVCPTDLVNIAGTLKELGSRADEVQPVFITLDPTRDRPEVLREYVKAFHPSIVPLRGSEAQTPRVATSFKVFYEKTPATTGGNQRAAHGDDGERGSLDRTVTAGHGAVAFTLGSGFRHKRSFDWYVFVLMDLAVVLGSAGLRTGSRFTPHCGRRSEERLREGGLIRCALHLAGAQPSGIRRDCDLREVDRSSKPAEIGL